MSRKWSISRNQFWPRVTNLPRHFSSRHLRVLWSPQSIFNDFDIKQSLMFLSRGDFYHPWHTFAVLLLWSGKWGRGWRRLLSRHQDLRLRAGPGHGGPLIRKGVKTEGTEKSFNWNIESHNPLFLYCTGNIVRKIYYKYDLLSQIHEKKLRSMFKPLLMLASTSCIFR